MYETVKVVNGYEIIHMVGARGFYRVNVWERNGNGAYRTFRTIRDAVQFCATLPAKEC